MIPHHLLMKYEKKPVWVVNQHNRGFRGILDFIGTTHVEMILLNKKAEYDGRVVLSIDTIDCIYTDEPETNKIYCEYLAALEEPTPDVVFQQEK